MHHQDDCLTCRRAWIDVCDARRRGHPMCEVEHKVRALWPLLTAERDHRCTTVCPLSFP